MASKSELLVDKHVTYVCDLFRHPSFLEHYMAEHLKMNALYWGLSALQLVHRAQDFKREDIVEFILSCYDSCTGGFGAAPKHDPHLLSTLSALQVLKLYDALDVLGDRKQAIIGFVKSMQLEDGSFQGDRFGEVDTRFVYNGLQSLALLEALEPNVVDPAIAWILRCQNFDGSFGMVPDAESHAAQVFTCLGCLAIAGKLDELPQRELLEWWLSDRQVDNGGLNGRPEKLPDVCYSWWVVSSLSMLGKLEYIDKEKLMTFILSCQDEKLGGISDRPDRAVDVYHTYFGIAGLSLIGYQGLEPIDPIYCLPLEITKSIKKYPY